VAEYRTRNLEPLLELFNQSKKAEVHRHCRGLKIYGSDLAGLIMAGRIGGIGPFKYACHFDDRIPEHLRPKPSEYAALGRAKVGPLEGEARKFFRKIAQTSEERRLFAAHLFYTPNQRYWHLFYFDQRDTAESRNHWRNGSHIHYANDMFHHKPLPEVWNRVQAGEIAFLKGLHIRYER
jgi:hypothetical protein